MSLAADVLGPVSDCALGVVFTSAVDSTAVARAVTAAVELAAAACAPAVDVLPVVALDAAPPSVGVTAAAARAALFFMSDKRLELPWS